MRLRSPWSLALQLASFLVFVSAVPAGAVVVQGFESTALGSADVGALAVPDKPRKLVIHNLGSSGQDGVALDLHQGSGITVTFDQPTDLGGSTIEKRALTLYANGEFPGEKIPIIKGSALGSGGGSQRKINCPYVFTVTVEVWSGATRVLSQTVPIATVVGVSGGSDVTPEGTQLIGYSAKTGKAGSPKMPRRIGMWEHFPSPRNVTVGSTTVAGDQLVFTVESPDLPDQFESADLTCGTNLAALSNGNVTIGELSLIKSAPRLKPRMVVAPVAMQIGDDMTWLDDSEDAVRYSVDGGGPGGGGAGGTLRVQSVKCKYFDEATREWAERKWTIDLQPGTPWSIEMDAQVDDGSGLPPQTFTFAGAIPTPTTQIAFASLIPGDDVTVQALSQGRPVGQPAAAGLGSHVQFSTAPIGVTTSGGPNSCAIDLEFPAGTTFEMNGQIFTGNMLHMHSHGTHARRISDVRIVHPPGTPPGTYRLTGLSSSDSPPGSETGGRDLTARGPRQTVSLDGSFATNDERITVTPADDEVDVDLNGLPSVSFESRPEPGDVQPDGESLALSDCTDYTCLPSRKLDITKVGATWQVLASFPAGSTGQYIEVDREMIPITLTEAQGGQGLTVSAASAIQPRPILKSFRWLSPQVECFKFEFSEPIQFSSGLGTKVTRSLVWWSYHDNPEVVTLAPVVATSLNMLPPGTPWTEWRTAPPTFQSSGNGTVREDVPFMLDGIPVTSTWASGSGVDVTGEPGGTLKAEHSYMFRLERSALTVKYYIPRVVHGYAHQLGPEPAGLIWSPRSNVAFYGLGDVAGMAPNSRLNGIEMEFGDAQPNVVHYDAGNLGGNALASLTLAGWEVGSASTNDVEVSRRYDLVISTDIDGDGQYEIQCRFPPGTTATLPGQLPVSIDQLTFTPVGASSSVLRSASLDLTDVPPGIPLEGVTIAEVMAPGTAVGVPPATPPIAGLEFRGVMPNPARGASTVRLALGRDAKIRVQVLDVTGREIARLADGVRPAGEHSFTWSGVTDRGSKVGAGLYFVRVSGDGFPTHTARMIRLD